jgi:transcriptional regulator with GAF, ATPase, and Fis domain
MNPQFIAIAGPLKGTMLELTDVETSIGRDSSNVLSINDRALSRNHCLIKREADAFKVYDLDSHNGTFVNELPAKEHVLKHGDRIQVGSSYFLFVDNEEKNFPASSDEFQLEDGTLKTLSTVQLSLEDAFCVIARDLGALIRIGALINTARGAKALQQELLKSILTIVPAERGTVLLIDEQLAAPSSVFTYEREDVPHSATRVSSTVVQQVVRDVVAILSNDVMTGNPLSDSDSLISSSIHSLLCVPLITSNKVIGVIYLTSNNPASNFTEGHLRMVTAIAGFAAGALQNAQHMDWLESENQRLHTGMQLKHSMIGESPRMREIYQVIAKVAPTNSTVLITGESGTGKELAASAIYHNSTRANQPFIVVNCATLNETLLESDLFGHERGAFTGAIAQKRGKIEIADGGTVFLDEVGEMTPPIQAKLLRVLQERVFERVGGTRTIKVNIRVIAATNKKLEEAVKNGSFRQDLYYRLNVVQLTMPPLRERAQDIQLLASYFILQYSKQCKRRVMGLSAEARRSLMSYDWPGNVRELENAIEHAIVLGSIEYIQPEDLPEYVLETTLPSIDTTTPYYDAVKEAKKEIIVKALEKAGGNYTAAAKLLGVHPNNLHRLTRNMNLKMNR